MQARLLNALIALAIAFALGGCASLNQVTNDVSTYSAWPAERKPATYAFERLPSQQGNPQQQQLLEDAAAPALQQAGFTPAADPASADVTVTLGARVYATNAAPYYPGFGYYGYYGYFGPWGRPFGPWGHPWGYPWGYGWGEPGGSPGGGYYSAPLYEREVAMLIRDRRTGAPLYETRVTNDGYTTSTISVLSAMFAAGLVDFPKGGPNPRRIVTPIAS